MIALAEDPGSGPSTHVKQLTTACSSSSGDPALKWCTHRHAGSYTSRERKGKEGVVGREESGL